MAASKGRREVDKRRFDSFGRDIMDVAWRAIPWTM